MRLKEKESFALFGVSETDITQDLLNSLVWKVLIEKEIYQSYSVRKFGKKHFFIKIPSFRVSACNTNRKKQILGIMFIKIKFYSEKRKKIIYVRIKNVF